jgi:hypothetical protein
LTGEQLLGQLTTNNTNKEIQMQIAKLLKSPAAVNRLLSKIGVANETTKKLYPTAVLIKDANGNWAIAHFKEMLALTQNNTTEHAMDQEDIARFNNILCIAVRFGMIELDFTPTYTPSAPIKILKNQDLQENGGEWVVQKKFTPSSQKMSRIYMNQSSI